MSSFNRDNLPDAQDYYENTAGLKLVGSGPWRTARCEFHGGSNSMRINLKSGGFMCMNCLEKGGDVLAYHQKAKGLDFIDAAKALGAWHEDGKPDVQHRPKPLPAGDALLMLAIEANLIAVAGGNIYKGVTLTDADRARVLKAVNRIAIIQEAFQ